MGDLEIGRRIRQVRRSLGLTQAQFGTKVGIAKISVARYETGRVPRAYVLASIAVEGGVTVEWLLHGDKSPKSPERRGVSSGTNVAPQTQRLVTLLERNNLSVLRLPRRFQTRYQQRADELVSRVGRELQEYVKLLQTEYRLQQEAQ